MRFPTTLVTIATSAAFALASSPAWSAPVTIRQLAAANSAAPGGGTYSGIDSLGPRISPTGEVFFNDSTTGFVVGQPGSFARLNFTAETVSGLTLASGETIDSRGGIDVQSSAAPGDYLVRASLSSGGAVLAKGSPGAFTKILRTGDPLPGTPATWAPTRFSPTFYQRRDLPTTRSGDPMIQAITADDSAGYIGLFRNGVWENTRVGGIPAPGYPSGNTLNLDGINVRAGNSQGQFVFDAVITNPSAFGQQAAYIGKNGTLQLMMKAGDILPGDSRPITGSFRPGSINNSGTVAISGFMVGVEGFVYRWSAAGATKVITAGDPIPDIGPRAIFKGPNSFLPPLINASGAVVFMGDVLVGGNSSEVARAALLYQSAPGAPIRKIAMHGDTINGLPEGNVAFISNTDDVTFNDAGQIAYICATAINTALGGSTGTNSLVFSAGTAPNISVIARQNAPALIDGITSSKAFTGLTKPNPTPGSSYTHVSGELGAILGDAGDIVFRGTFPGGFFGISSVFQARLNVPQTSPLSAQNITFPQPFDRLAAAGSLALSATSSSGLPVSFSLVSGPATLSGNTLTFSGNAGDVLVRATQAGSSAFLQAEAIDRKILVRSDGSLLPPPGSALITPIRLPL